MTVSISVFKKVLILGRSLLASLKAGEKISKKLKKLF
jgi:hypothetical protein